MSKILLLVSFLALISCGDDKAKPQGDVGGERQYEEVDAEFEDKINLQSICNALSNKEDVIDNLMNAGKDYVFSYAQKDCKEEKLPDSKTVATNIVKSESSYLFKPKNGEAFGFKNIETSKDGIMKHICRELELDEARDGDTIKSPMKTSSTGAIWFTTITDKNRCRPDESSICINIQRGSRASEGKYKIHTNEWVKFRMTNPVRGFFTERMLITTASCSKGEIHQKAVLK